MFWVGSKMAPCALPVLQGDFCPVFAVRTCERAGGGKADRRGEMSP